MPPISRAILYDERGRRRDDADVVREVGHIGLRLARLQDAEARLAPGEPLRLRGRNRRPAVSSKTSSANSGNSANSTVDQ